MSEFALPLTRDGIKQILPHREPMLLLDRVLELVPGEHAIAEWTVKAADPVLAGHFPGQPVYPGVLIVEALAQTGAVALLSLPELRGKIPLFGGIDHLRFRRPVQPGETLRLEAEMGALRHGIGHGHGRALVNGEIAAEGDLLFAAR